MPPEIETPVGAEDPAANPKATLTSHLTGLTPPPADVEADEAEEAADAAAGVKLPKTLKDSLAMLNEAQAMQPENKAATKMRDGVIERLRAHIHALSQGPTCKALTAEGHAALAATSTSHADEIHLTLLCRSDRVVADRLAALEKENADLREQLAATKPKPSKQPQSI
jgi:hypothetical protein